jgi:GH18 family chitinase
VNIIISNQLTLFDFADFTNWATYRFDEGKYLPEDVDADLCTHIVYGFAVLNPQTLQIRAHDSWIDFDKGNIIG